MNKKNLARFRKIQKEIYKNGEKNIWKIPQGTDKKKGDFGLLPEDKEIRAWQISPVAAEFLHFLSLSIKSKIILELGTSIGYSTIRLGLTAKQTRGHVYGTEFFPAKARIAKENFKKIGLNKFITLYEENIKDVLAVWPKNKKIDFVFMDADQQNYHLYLSKLYPLLNCGGIIAVDNVGDFAHHMKRFLAQVARLKKVTTYMLNIDHGILLIHKDIR